MEIVSQKRRRVGKIDTALCELCSQYNWMMQNGKANEKMQNNKL